jgi:dienelactone hydrolase
MRFAPEVPRSAQTVALACVALILIGPATLQAADDAPPTVGVPRPSGPFPVGTFSTRFVDAARNDPFLHDGTNRELMVRFWYPAARVVKCSPAAYSSPKVWAYLSELLGQTAPPVRSNSCWQAPVMAGSHPVILASHGYTGMFTDYTFLLEDLASRGYLVVSIAHTYETTAVEFPDGRLVTSRLGSHLMDRTLQTEHRSLQLAASVRLTDLKFVLGELKRLNVTGGPLSERLDLSHVGILGHSLGGDTAMTALRQLGLTAAVLLDAMGLSRASIRGTDQPTLLVSEGREEWSEAECQLWNNLRGPRIAIVFRGAEHLTPSDALWLGRYIPALQVETGTMGPEKTVAAVRNSVGAFFDAYLLGKPPGLLLNGLSTDYADAGVTTRTQHLCNQPLAPTQQTALWP